MNTELISKLQKLYEDAANIIMGSDKGFDSVNTISNGANILVEHMDELKTYPSVYEVLTRCVYYVNKDFDEGTTFQDYVDMGDQLIEDISGYIGEFLEEL